MNNEIKKYLNYKKQRSFNDTLFAYIDKSGKKDSEIYKNADIDRKLFSKIKCNDNYIPKKKTIIKLCLALKLNQKEFDSLLNSAGYCLINSEFDQIIAYFVENKIYDLNIVNENLYNFCNTSL